MVTTGSSATKQHVASFQFRESVFPQSHLSINLVNICICVVLAIPESLRTLPPRWKSWVSLISASSSGPQFSTGGPFRSCWSSQGHALLPSLAPNVPKLLPAVLPIMEAASQLPPLSLKSSLSPKPECLSPWHGTALPQTSHVSTCAVFWLHTKCSIVLPHTRPLQCQPLLFLHKMNLFSFTRYHSTHYSRLIINVTHFIKPFLIPPSSLKDSSWI